MLVEQFEKSSTDFLNIECSSVEAENISKIRMNENANGCYEKPQELSSLFL